MPQEGAARAGAAVRARKARRSAGRATARKKPQRPEPIETRHDEHWLTTVISDRNGETVLRIGPSRLEVENSTLRLGVRYSTCLQRARNAARLTIAGYGNSIHRVSPGMLRCAPFQARHDGCYC